MSDKTPPNTGIETTRPKVKKLHKAMKTAHEDNIKLGTWEEFEDIHNGLVTTIRETSRTMAQTTTNKELVKKMDPMVAKSYLLALTVLSNDLRAYANDLAGIRKQYDGKSGTVRNDDEDADLYWMVSTSYAKLANVMTETIMAQLADIGTAAAEAEAVDNEGENSD